MTDAELVPLLGLSAKDALKREKCLTPAARISSDVVALAACLRIGRLHQQDAQNALSHLTFEADTLPAGIGRRIAVTAVAELARLVAK